MNEQEWKNWALKLDGLLDRIGLVNDVEELRGLAEGLQQWDSEGLEACGRNNGMDWTWHMGGDWMEDVQKLQTHLEGLDPKEFDAMVASRNLGRLKPRGGR